MQFPRNSKCIVLIAIDISEVEEEQEQEKKNNRLKLWLCENGTMLFP